MGIVFFFLDCCFWTFICLLSAQEIPWLLCIVTYLCTEFICKYGVCMYLMGGKHCVSSFIGRKVCMYVGR